MSLTRDRLRTKALQIENRRLRKQVRDLEQQVRAAYILGSEDARAYLEGNEQDNVETLGEASS